MNPVSWLCSNYCHVAWSNRKVIRFFYERMKNKSFSKEERKEIYKSALDYHKKNKDLYYFVMHGRL